MHVDYTRYAEGEALLGWLNATAQLGSGTGFDAEAVLVLLARDIQRRLGGAEIAHLKMTLRPVGGHGDIAVINLVRSGYIPELSQRLSAVVTTGELIINCRAEADPDLIRESVRRALTELPEKIVGLTAQLEHLESFRPGKPQPTHRDVLAPGRRQSSSPARGVQPV
jgi:hypothetical protein